jgi:hypothetical protein
MCFEPHFTNVPEESRCAFGSEGNLSILTPAFLAKALERIDGSGTTAGLPGRVSSCHESFA